MKIIKDVVSWACETFPHATPATVINHLSREVEELIKAGILEEKKQEIADCFILLVHHSALSGYKLYYECTSCQLLEETIIGSIAESFINLSLAQKYFDQEVIIYNARMLLKHLYTHSSYCKYDIFEEVQKKLDINRKRRWKEPDSEGVSEHVK